MFHRILVPIDGSSRGGDAIQTAAQLADHFGGDLVLLRVEGALAPLGQVLADHRALERQVSDLRQRGLRVHHTVEFGRPDRSIADGAEAERVALIVLAPHHRTRLEAFWHPGVVSHLLGHTLVPLLVLPESAAKQPETHPLGIAGSLILAPLDGSDLAERALPYAVAFARAYARPLLLVYVIPAPGYMGATAESLLADADYVTRAEADAHAYLCAVRGRLGRDHPDLHIQSMILSGEPWRELLRCAETHDGSLVVMSTHGRTGVRRALLGSVAGHLARACPLPLLIVPPDAGTRGQAIPEPLRTASVASQR